MKNQYRYIWLILGLGSALQLVASLSISELICIVWAPLLLISDINEIRHHGLGKFLALSFLVVCGGLVSCIVNKTPGYFFLRGMAVACLMPCVILVSHRLIVRDPAGFKWYLLGGAISAVLSTFVFQKSVEVTMLAGGIKDANTAELIISGPIYWINRAGSFVMLPIKGWYLSTPFAYSVLAPILFGVFSILTSASGRSAAVVSMFSAALVFAGGKSIRTMRRLSRHMILLIVLAIILSFGLKAIYQYAAQEGILGENARLKLEVQTKGRTDMLSLLIGGRIDSFAGYLACIDHPIIGMGACPIDEKGYFENFLRRFGNAEDYENYVRNRAWEMSMGLSKSHMVPAHSSIVIFWLQFGIFGFIFWMYMLYTLYHYIHYDLVSVPSWFGWLALTIPSFLWDAFFSPFSGRVGVPMIIVACLMARAVRQNKFNLPLSMVNERIKFFKG